MVFRLPERAKLVSQHVHKRRRTCSGRYQLTQLIFRTVRDMQVARLQAELRVSRADCAAATTSAHDAAREARTLTAAVSAAEDEARKLRNQLASGDKRRARDAKAAREAEARVAELEGKMATGERQLSEARKALEKVCTHIRALTSD